MCHYKCVSRDFKCLTVDVITSCVFSYDTNVFGEKDNVFMRTLKEFFDSFDLMVMTWTRFAKVVLCGKTQFYLFLFLLFYY